MPNDRRVVVTGLGVVSSLGIGWQEWWKNIMAGKSGISRITSFDSSSYDRHFAGEIKKFKATDFISDKRVLQMGRASQLAVAAGKLAMADTGFRIRKSRNTRIGICIGTTMGEPQVMEEFDARQIPQGTYDVDKRSAMNYSPTTIAANVAKLLKLNGPNIMFSNACAAGNYAVGLAYDYIRSGKVDFMLAGGADAFSRIAFTGFSRLYAVAPEKCQPFDRDRQGMIPGEGGAILFLESLESALKRKTNIYAEIKSYGLSCDARHMTHPDPNGIQKAIRKSLKAAGVEPQDINYISAHGTGTKENDRSECQAFASVFGANLKQIPASSIKSMLGHTMGAASAFESIACCLALKNNEIPPTINLSHKDPECDIDCVPQQGRKHYTNVVINNSQAFGGNNASLIFSGQNNAE
jgi:3-oxoacyl-[acyl-carrier-protein] synthase II